MNGAIRALLVIAFVALVTFFTRLLPFVLFPEGKETPPYVKYLGKVLPFAIIAMLMVYCLKGTSLLAVSYTHLNTIYPMRTDGRSNLEKEPM